MLDALAHGAGTTCQADGACANDFANAVGFQNVQQGVELLLGTGCFDDNGLGGNVGSRMHGTGLLPEQSAGVLLRLP